MNQPFEPVVGRVNTVMVFGGPGHAAAVCTVLAQVRTGEAPVRVSTSGVIRFDPALIDHIEQHLVPIVEAIGRTLLRCDMAAGFDLSVVNPGAASVHDRAISIGGFSADGAILVAMLSALLQIPVRRDIAISGHISSDRGDIAAVGSLPEKLLAVVSDRSLRKYLVPALHADSSLPAFLPAEYERACEAVVNARRFVRVVEVATIFELIRQTVDEESIVLGSLDAGFFDVFQGASGADTTIESATRLLGANLDARFWSIAEGHLFPLDTERLHRLLNARAACELGRRRYPQGFGSRLRRLISSLPPSSRRTAALFPLLANSESLALCGLAQPEHHEDVQDLLAVCSGRGMSREYTRVARPPQDQAKPGAAVASVLAELSVESLTAKISAPVDTARVLFTLDGIAAESDADFWETVTSVYVALLRHTGSEGASAENPVVIAESHGLLEHAFADKGGVQAAKQEGRFPTSRGGMRFVLDVVADQFKADRQNEYVRRVVAEAFDSLDWPATVRFMSSLLDHLRQDLPSDALPESPAQLVPRCAEILLTYVRSRDRMTQLIRSL